jgi:Arylsulfotransferase (ASST).
MRVASARSIVVALLAGCDSQPAAPATPDAPTIHATISAPNAQNVLSALVSVRFENADSIAVRFGVDGTSPTQDSITPGVKSTGDSIMVPVFGLLPETHYRVLAVAYGPGGTTTGDPVEVTTGVLPADLPHFTASGIDPSPGFVVFASGPYGVVIDNTGRVVWYLRFQNGPGLNFMAEPNGHYVARPTPANPSPTDAWLEIDPLGNIVRSRGCALGFQSRPHDLVIDKDDGHWLLCDEIRTMDLTSAGGVAGARVTGTAVQHLDKDGNLLFSWSAFEHLDITDGEPADRKGATVNWTHGNALDIDGDGNLLVSFRNLSEITKISSTSGAVIWRLGGRRNQFAFANSFSPAFVGQHGVRAAPGGLEILDNLGTAGDSRGELYTIDETAKVATLSRVYESSPGVVTQIGGSVQRLPGGRTLVSVGTAGRVEEYEMDGRVVWRIDGNPGYIFRAQRIRSLYTPGVGTTR